jgi:hypothetical protein
MCNHLGSCIAIVQARETAVLSIPYRSAMSFCLSGHLATSVLREINARRLYVLRYPTWEEYCEKHLDMSKARSHQLIESAGIVDKLSTLVDVLPTKETHCRALLALESDDDRAAVWRRLSPSVQRDHVVSTIRHRRTMLINAISSNAQRCGQLGNLGGT